MARALPVQRTIWASGRLPGRNAGLLLLLLLLLVGGAWLLWTRVLNPAPTAPPYQTATVNRVNLITVVSGTGPITTAASLPLTFKSSGRLAELDVQVGDQVTTGQVLARLDTADLEAQVAQAKSNLSQQLANQAKVVQGPTAEQIGVAQAQL